MLSCGLEETQLRPLQESCFGVSCNGLNFNRFFKKTVFICSSTKLSRLRRLVLSFALDLFARVDANF